MASANVNPIFTGTIINPGVQFTSTDTTTKKTIYTAGTNGALLDGILISSNDTSAAPLAFYINDGTTDHYIGVVAVPAGSGYTTIARVDGMTTLAPANLKNLALAGGYILKAAVVSTMTAAKTLDCLVTGGSF